MLEKLKFYINGEWVDPATPATLDVINPATEEPCAKISMGASADVDAAVAAAKAAFPAWSRTSKEERLGYMAKIVELYQGRYAEIAQAISMEMGAPISLATAAQAAMGVAHFGTAMETLKNMEFEEQKGTTRIVKEPVGVCGFITPWNWPINQIVCKVAPALATGCTMVLKPSEVAPINAMILAEIIDEAGLPKGVFNLVNGDGAGVGTQLSSHPDVDMVSITGSTRAGIAVAKTAAETVKRVSQELGGKSPNIILDDADFEKAVTEGVRACFINVGQACRSPSRMLVPHERMEEAKEIAKRAAEAHTVGDPMSDVSLGPVVNDKQFAHIQSLISAGIKEGATLVAGGEGRPEGLDKGYYIRPTVFGDVTNDMAVAQEEIFGPVLAIIGYKDEEHAIDIANDTIYGLSGYVQSADLDRARRVARRLRVGSIWINGADWAATAPFGGYKQSGNGREHSKWGLEDYLEVKSTAGYE